MVAIRLHYIEHFRSFIANGILLFYWLFIMLTNGIKVINLLLQGTEKSNSVYFIFSLFLFINSLFILIFESFIKPSTSVYTDFFTEFKNPLDYSNIFERLTFTWISPLMEKGFKQFLTSDDLPQVPTGLTASDTSKIFNKYWQHEIRTKTKPSLSLALIKSFGGPYFIGALFKALHDILAFTQPQLLRLLVKFVHTYSNSNPDSITKGASIAIGMFLVSVIQTAVLHQYFQRVFDTGMKVKTSLTSIIYKKSLVLSNEERAISNTGDIVNLMSVDTQRLQDLAQFLQMIWSGPFQLILCLVSLYNLLGNSMWAGVAITAIMIPLNARIARYQKDLQKKQMKNKDQRTRLISEILNNIKSLKLYGWEKPFQKRLLYVRNEKELKTLKQIGIFNALFSFLWSCVPFLVSSSTFALFVLTQNEPLSTDIVFPALTLFNLLSFPLGVIPMVVTSLIEANVSISRLTNFFTSNEVQIDSIIHLDKANKIGDDSVIISDGTFLWKKEIDSYKIALQNINYIAKKGELSCIVGKVGSGKSAFLQSILGELHKLNGTITIMGKIAYSPQIPWIMNGTVEENILFGSKYDKLFYEKTINACALKDDLKILPDGDQTEVGEKGISLSGGQKARLSLARAVYARADVYLLDDILSAVDEHVGKHLIDNVLGPNGLLQHKCKILATNSINILTFSDNITMVLNGEITESGTYEQIMSSESPLKQLIKDFGKKSQNSSSGNSTTIVENSEDLDNDSNAAIDDISEVEVFNINNSKRINDNERRKSFISLRRASIASFTKPNLSSSSKNQIINQSKISRKEHQEQGKVNWNVYKEYFYACNPFGVSVFLSCLVLSAAVSVAGNFWLKNWSEKNSETGSNPQVGKYLGVYLALGIIASFLSLAQTITLWIWCTIQGSKILHESMTSSVLRAPMSFFETTPIGRILNRFSSDIYKVDEVLGRVFSQFFANVVKVSFTMIVICSSTWQFFFFILPIGVLYVLYQRYYLMTSRELKRLDSVTKSPIFAHFQETLCGVSTIRAYSQERRFNYLNESKVDLNMKAYHPAINTNRWLAVRLEFLGSLIILGASGLTILTIKSNKLTDGMVGLAMSYALQITQSLNWIVRMTVEVETNIVSVERILEYSNLPSEAPEIINDSRPPLNWPSKGGVIFKNYSTKYRPELDLVLKNINLNIKPKEKIGIVGRTGAGKSSLTLALFRIIEPVSGGINIDDINTTTIGLQDLRHRLSIIPQDSQVFEGTIRQNIDPNNEYTNDEIWKALKLSHLSQHVEQMGNGLDAAVTEGGGNLSVGQRQLMCLARALLIPSNVLVLDEATAAVDVETDHVLQQTIRTEFAERTILTIAHRLNTIMDSDRIVVLNGGEVAEFDTPSELLKNPESLFYSLCKQGGFVGNDLEELEEEENVIS